MKKRRVMSILMSTVIVAGGIVTSGVGIATAGTEGKDEVRAEVVNITQEKNDNSEDVVEISQEDIENNIEGNEEVELISEEDVEFVIEVAEEEIDENVVISEWARDFYKELKGKGLLKGKLEDKSDFKEEITREEFAELMVNYLDKFNLEEGEGLEFTDTDNPNVIKATKLGIVSGNGKGKFNPDGRLTREQLAAMVSRVDKLVTKDKKIYGEDLSMFDDSAEISSWAKEGVARVAEVGLVQGNGQGKFDPKGTATREQALSIVSKLVEIRGLNEEVRDLDIEADIVRESETEMPQWLKDLEFGIQDIEQ